LLLLLLFRRLLFGCSALAPRGGDIWGPPASPSRALFATGNWGPLQLEARKQLEVSVRNHRQSSHEPGAISLVQVGVSGALLPPARLLLVFRNSCLLLLLLLLLLAI